jgi:NAD(P)-dependent dehydrogenase (short-subunit alcohol dehydrogenase family)
MFDLTGKVAIVTGSSQGLGQAIAVAMARAGANIAVIAREPETVTRGKIRPHAPVEPVVEEINSLGVRAVGITADVREADQVALMVRHVREKLGRVDVLVNNAGGSWGETFRSGPLLEVGPEDFAEAFRLNVTTAFLCSSAVVPVMREQGEGSIINISAMGGRGPTPGAGAYASAKAALINLTQTMAAEWAPAVRVNVIAPGFIETPHRTRGRSREQKSNAVQLVALGRPGAPEEYTGAVIFLASDAATYITGSVLDIHGGRMTW